MTCGVEISKGMYAWNEMRGRSRWRRRRKEVAGEGSRRILEEREEVVVRT